MRALAIVSLALACGQASAAVWPPPGPYKMRPAEVEEVLGVYILPNGVPFKVTNEHHRLYGQLGQRPPTELVPVAEHHFVAPAQHMTMVFHPHPFDDEIVLTYPSVLNPALAEMMTVRLAIN